MGVVYFNNKNISECNLVTKFIVDNGGVIDIHEDDLIIYHVTKKCGIAEKILELINCGTIKPSYCEFI